MSLSRKLTSYGLALTAVPLLLVTAGVWLVGRQSQTAAYRGNVSLAHTDLQHIVQVAHSAADVLGSHGGAASGEALLDRLKAVTIGRTGYIFVLRGTGPGRGSYVLSKDRQRDGEDLWNARDADGRLFIQHIITAAVKLPPGQAGEVRYPWQNAGEPRPRQKIAVFQYYAPRDWVIAASVPEDEFTTAAEDIRRLFARSTYTLAIGVLIMLGVSGLIWTVVGRNLTRAMTAMIDRLSSGAMQVASASGQVATSAQALSQGATEQAASLEETSASMGEMTSTTRQNAEHTDQAAALVIQTERAVAGANQALADMVASMGAIKESSDKVARILRTIDEIAFQTNILSLNAAVEAARAGEAGLGFAVVADEVRALAQRAAQAAKDTAALIDESIARADQGHRRVSQMTAAMSEITNDATKVKALMAELSVAGRQQAQGIEQVSQAVAQMEKVTQMTAASAEESAAASEELNAQAKATTVVVGQLAALVGGRPPAPTGADRGGRRTPVPQTPVGRPRLSVVAGRTKAS